MCSWSSVQIHIVDVLKVVFCRYFMSIHSWPWWPPFDTKHLHFFDGSLSAHPFQDPCKIPFHFQWSALYQVIWSKSRIFAFDYHSTYYEKCQGHASRYFTSHSPNSFMNILPPFFPTLLPCFLPLTHLSRKMIIPWLPWDTWHPRPRGLPLSHLLLTLLGN